MKLDSIVVNSSMGPGSFVVTFWLDLIDFFRNPPSAHGKCVWVCGCVYVCGRGGIEKSHLCINGGREG